MEKKSTMRSMKITRENKDKRDDERVITKGHVHNQRFLKGMMEKRK
jgi:hypothetical protein